jgi:uncharacterized YccA/Bax inhibitor family protein
MSNPLLNDDRLATAANSAAVADGGKPGWAAPKPGGASGTTFPPPGNAPLGAVPISDGPVSTWHAETMTVGGVAQTTGILFLLLMVGAFFGWSATTTSITGQAQLPGLAIGAIFVGFALAMLLAFKPMLAKFIAPIYAVVQGYFVGAISKAYESQWDGIVVQAAGATLGVFAVMLFLYRTRILKVTNRMRRIVIGATLGVAVFYGISLLINLFGGSVGFLSSTSGFSIAFSFFVAGLAAFNLALDFDFIERGAAAGMPKQVEWYAAFGILVTVVWLYLEILRLLAKLRER